MTTKICGKAVEGSPLTLVDLLRRHAASAASSSDAANAKSEISSGFTWMDDSGNVARKLTYGDLEREARAVAQGLQAKKAQSQRVLLVFEPGLDFIIGFFGCVYAGAIAVPVYPPIKDEDFFKLDGLVIDCEARFMLTTSAVYKSLQRKLLNPLARGGYALKKLLPVAIDLLDRTPSAWSPPDVSPTSPAYLQYTSGSTAFPKGVVVTHANAVYNAVAISHLLDTQAPRQLGLCWLPLYHDMGLVGNVLSVLYSRMPMMLMAPSSFLKRPDMFLQLVARHRVTHVAAPNFAYELCARKLPDAFARELDLSHLRVALNGAEQVQASTLQRFSDKFAPSGFTMDKFYACYGLAEATLILTGGQQGMPPTLLPLPAAAAAGGAASGGKPSDLLVACGTGLPEGEIRIVDPVSHKPCPSLSVGEIWARGPGVSPGYYGQPDRTEEVFAAKVAEGAQEEQSSVSAAPVYMRTGDLGFVNEKGELFVTGRLKDLIIVRGRNIYPLDIEWTIHNTSDLIRPGCCAVFSVRLDEHEREQEEKVVAVAELRQPIADSKERDELVQSIKAAVARGFDGLELHDVVLVQDHTVPKTSSGKLMRFACRYSYLQASLARLDSSRRHYQQQHQASPSQTQRQAGGLVGGVVGKLVQVFKPRRDALQRFIVSKVAEAVELDAANIDPSCDVRSYGMDSLRQMQLLRELEDRLGCALPTSLCDEYNSIEQIVDLLLSDAYTKISPRLIKFIDEELAAFKPEKRRERRKGSFDLMREESQAKGEEDDDSDDDDDDEEEDVSVAAEDVSAASIREPAAPELPEGYPTEDGEPIAIVGMACRVPKAKNLGEFWANLETGVDAISRIPADRWNAEAFYDADMDKPGKMPTTQGGFLEDIDKFDAGFFHIGAREAEVMDPQQRMVLEVVYEALEDAGMAMEKLRGSRTGVFTGVCFSDYHKVQVADPDKIRPYVQTGCASSIVPNRVSYFYDLKGPSFTVDTACSSSLVALHLACESIRRGECDRAIVAGTSTNLLPEMFIAFAKLHMLSPNGRCRAFDASGDGYVRSEGICVLVIEPLATAARERDAVRALVRATGTNQDGRTAGLTFPGRDAQAALLREVYARAKLSPLDVQFIEAHGTGTRAGDPVEAGAIGSVLGEVRPRDNPLLIGSVKSNIGHLEGASGLAGLIKAVLAMERGIIPANLHFHTPNPDIDFDAMRLKVAASSLPWPACPVRRAGVNSFGFGGSNAHAVLEQAPHLPALALRPSRDQQRQRRHQRPSSSSSSSTAAAEQQQEEKQTTSGAEVAAAAAEALPVVLSAHTKQALADLQAAYAARLAGGGDGLGLGEESDGERLMDLAYTLSCRRTHHAYRLSAVVSSAAELAAELPKAKISKMREADKEKKVLFVFTGQGAQWYAMGRQLLRAEPVFLASMRECDRIVRGLVGWSVLEVLAQDEATSIVNRPDIAQPCTTSLQVSLVRLWRHWGVEPAVVVGHSSGEIATAYAAGALSLEATIRTAVMRGEAMKVNESGKGKMAAVGMNEQEAAEFLAPYQGRVGIAAVNSPTNCTISGDADAMDEIGRVLQERGVFCQFLRIDCAYHSHHMVPVGNRLTELLTGLETLGGDSAPTRVPMISTVLGAPCLASDLGADYWVRNLVSMVRFWPAIEAAFQQSPLLPKIDVVVEIGPHPALQGPLRQCLLALSSQPPAVLPSLIRKEDEHRRIMLSLCALHEAGVEVAWSRVFRDKLLQGHREPRLVRGLPSFPWQRKSYWHESDTSRQSRFRELGHELLGHRLHQAHGAALWQNELKVPHLPYLKDHVVQGSIVFPGAGYIAMAAAIPTEAKAGAQQQQQQPQGSAPEPVAIEEIVFKKALLFETDQTPVKTQLTLADKPDDEGRRDFTVFSADGSAWQEHCSGKHRRLGPAAAAQADAETAAAAEANRALMQAVRDRCPHFVSKDECYKVFNDAGLEYGPDFQGIEELHRGDGEAWAVVSSVPCALPPAGSSYAIHPTVLDACFQVLIGAVGGSLSESYLPVRIGKVEVRSACREAKYFVHATAKKPAQGSFVGDIRLFGLADAREKVAVEGLLCASIGKKGGAKKGEEDGAWEWNESLYEFVWKPDLAQLVRTGLVARAVPPTDAPWDDEPERVTLAYLRRVAASFAADPAKRDRLVPLYRPLLDWIDAAVLAATEEPASSLLPAAGGAFFGAEEEKGLADESLVVHRIGFHLEEILLGATDPLSLLFKDDTVYRVYEKGPTFYQANQVLGHALDLLAHKHGQLRVLEIGAGTGGTTSHALPVLGKRFASYTFTDISPSFFEKAKAKFAPWAGRMKFQVLDIEKDVEAQGFAPESFDLIVATDVLHATVDIVRTLTSVRGLLAPGGHLLMNEFVNTPMWIQTVFGTLSGWWRFQDPERRSVGPTLSEQAWRQAFLDSGWAHVHPLHDRRPRPIHATFLATTAAAAAADITGVTAPVYVLADELDLTPSEQQQPQQQQQQQQEAVIAHLASLCVAAQRELVRVREAAEVPAHASVVYLPSLSSPAVFEGVSDGEFERMKAVVGRCGEVYWVTRGGNMDCPLPQNAPLVGFSRVMKNERPGIKSCVVDVDPLFAAPEVAAAIFEALTSPHLRDEDEVVVRREIGTAGTSPEEQEHRFVFVPRVALKKVSQDLQRTEDKHYRDCAGLRLEVGTAGLLNTLQWRESQRRAPGKGEVEVQVMATGLNFKDVMLAMGMLSDEAVEGGFCGKNLGIECAGVVAAVGEGASAAGLAVGQRVVCVARYCFSTYVTTLAPLVQPIPEWMTFEEAATIPATFLTALYALKNLGQIQAGEKVLIHAAAGGVGQAAIQLAHLFGAEVYATVGTRDKREFIERELGVHPDRIMNSRNLDFVQEVLEKTGGRGVDLVLNSLSGEALKKSVGVLAPFGRFLEIGKRDIYGNSKLDLLPFGQNLSFFAIDLDRLNGSHPETSGRIFKKLMQLFYERKLTPLPRKVYSFGRVEEAFRYMQQGKHIGKVILALRPDEPVRTLLPAFSFDPRHVYLLVGGLGGFGTAVARWMILRGATKLAFLSRSGASSPAAALAVQELAALGADLAVEKADAVDHAQLRDALARIRAHFPHASFGGVMQAAMVLDDCLLDDMTAERFRRVVAPKVRGTHNLVDLLAAEPLRFFVLFSSVSAVVGNLAQSNYAAANAYLDALAHHARAARALPLVSINWGAIGDVGYVAERKDLEESMKKRGIYTLPIDHALHVLQWAITDLPVQVVASPILWKVAANTLPSLTSARFRSLLVDDGGEGEGSGSGSGSSVSVFQQLSAAPEEERLDILRQSLRHKLSSMLGISAEDIEMSNKLTDLGVDSLMAVELKNWIDKEMKISLSVLDLTGGKSIDELVVKILSLSSLAPLASSTTSADAADPTVSVVSSSSDVEKSGEVGAVFECYQRVEKPKARLVCFPYLGGEPSAFKSWVSFLPSDVELLAYVPQRLSTWEELLPLITQQLALLDQAAPAPLVFYGHSMGGLIAYEVASLFRPSSQLVVAAIASPDEPSFFATEWEGWSDAVLAAAPVEDFMRVAMQQGLIVNTTLNPEIIRSSILLGKRYLPWRKATGLCGQGRKQMQSRLLAVDGENDLIFKDKTHILSWRDYTAGAFEFLSIAEGSHLFLNEEVAMSNFIPALSAVLDSAAQ